MCFRACHGRWISVSESAPDSETLIHGLLVVTVQNLSAFSRQKNTPSLPHTHTHPSTSPSCCLIPPLLPLLLLHLHSSILSLGFIQSVLTFDPQPCWLKRPAEATECSPSPSPQTSPWLEEDEGRVRLQSQERKRKAGFSMSPHYTDGLKKPPIGFSNITNNLFVLLMHIYT